MVNNRKAVPDFLQAGGSEAALAHSFVSLVLLVSAGRFCRSDALRARSLCLWIPWIRRKGAPTGFVPPWGVHPHWGGNGHEMGTGR
jgi:hypothetical protein